MRRLLVIAVLVVVVAVAQGCAKMPMQQSVTLVSGKVRVGMTRGEVVFILGKPQSTENVGQVEFLFYTPIWYALHLASSQSPIAIREAKVIGVGKTYYDQTVESVNEVKASKRKLHRTPAPLAIAFFVLPRMWEAERIHF